MSGVGDVMYITGLEKNSQSMKLTVKFSSTRMSRFLLMSSLCVVKYSYASVLQLREELLKKAILKISCTKQ